MKSLDKDHAKLKNRLQTTDYLLFMKIFSIFEKETNP